MEDENFWRATPSPSHTPRGVHLGLGIPMCVVFNAGHRLVTDYDLCENWDFEVCPSPSPSPSSLQLGGLGLVLDWNLVSLNVGFLTWGAVRWRRGVCRGAAMAV